MGWAVVEFEESRLLPRRAGGARGGWECWGRGGEEVEDGRTDGRTNGLGIEVKRRSRGLCGNVCLGPDGRGGGGGEMASAVGAER